MRLLKSKEKKERALGVKLGLKAFRCNSPKCALVRRPYRPGMHGKKFSRSASEFKLQLMEKQKIKFTYGLTERQMKNIFKKASAARESALDFIGKKLEMRLDNIVFRMGLAPSIIMARQLVSHGHFLVNGRKVTVPSYQVKVGDVIKVREKMKDHPLFKDLKNTLKNQKSDWFVLDAEKLEGTIKANPPLELPFNINLVVDYYSR